MTRNRDIDCEDIFGCDHRPETPVSENGEILYWMCRCGNVCPRKPAYWEQIPKKEETK